MFFISEILIPIDVIVIPVDGKDKTPGLISVSPMQFSYLSLLLTLFTLSVYALVASV